MTVVNRDYNIAAELVQLYGFAHNGHVKSQLGLADKITKLNDSIKDKAQLINCLTKGLATGVADASSISDVVDRIKSTKNIITAGADYVWKKTEDIKAQIELLKEDSSHETQDINLLYTKMGQAAKDISEITQM
ncbi:MAG: hypothetical protein JSS09_04750, partial [Verrucomicrobia bacterium]|nr:hypothetical protein [Verrucomicrobiota bacterium]